MGTECDECDGVVMTTLMADDELVVLCVALELAVRITIIPYTPPHALGQWAISAYGPEGADVVMHLGNNDVHYVYLSQGTR